VRFGPDLRWLLTALNAVTGIRGGETCHPGLTGAISLPPRKITGHMGSRFGFISLDNTTSRVVPGGIGLNGAFWR